ncbi:hypothetical protein [Clostridium baratii]|uniref:hypothetical protein n=1 Tax=Clostridium baratii TaxID=1561 RepID=UPI0030CF75A7
MQVDLIVNNKPFVRIMIVLVLILSFLLIFSYIKLCFSRIESRKSFVEAEILDNRRVGIRIENESSIDEAYLIYSNNVVKRLNRDEIEDTIENNLNEDIKFEIYNIDFGNIVYKYLFLFIKEKDGSYNLHIIYKKICMGSTVVNVASGIEVWGFESSNKDNPEYEGERIMARKYKEILKGISTYIR